ncbi:MAG: lasso peptide biosynthesis B2 protein [Lachnospiraceae bacterium]|nr:lasso peptide biosynthesis B2 protein [Lachnospiraceae bacterium]
MSQDKKQGCLPLRAIRFAHDNKCFFMIVRAFFYSAFYRLGLLIFKPKRMKKNWGTEKEESSEEESMDGFDYVQKVARAVLCVCNYTKWESKCLVRALTAGKLLRKKKLHYTLYLGVCQEDSGEMAAHAWLRWGKFIVTGKIDGLDRYAVVSTFRN